VPPAGSQLTAAADAPASPTITHYQQLADQADLLIDGIMTALPKLELPHPTTAKFVRGHQNVPIPFIEKTVAAVARREQLRLLNKVDVTFARDMLQLDEAYRPVVDKLFNFAKGLKYTLDARRAIVAAACLQMYYLIKGFGRDPEGADMLQLAEDLKRQLGRIGPKKSARPAEILPVAELDSALQPMTLRKKGSARGKEVPAVNP
jgi:hypothetical protein